MRGNPLTAAAWNLGHDDRMEGELFNPPKADPVLEQAYKAGWDAVELDRPKRDHIGPHQDIKAMTHLWKLT